MVSSATTDRKDALMFDVITGSTRPDVLDTAPITGSGPLAQRWQEENHGLKVVKVEVKEEEVK